MKILVVGGGGREHALAWKLHRDDPTCELIAAPGNAGISELARCVPIDATDIESLREFAVSEKVDFTIVGPEAPLAAGIVDRFRQSRLPIFGPTSAAARLETSKRFAKELMLANAIPTALATFHTSLESAKAAVRKLGVPIVVKASGLAGGKGVVVASSLEEAEHAVDSMLGDRIYDAARNEILVEEHMNGEELSLFVLTDGNDFVSMLPAQDHKRLLDGDAGPNTGGMGAYAPVSTGTAAVVRQAEDTIVRPALAAMRALGTPFTGLLYVGLMLTADGPKVVEFNCRFGDPETEAVLPLLRSNLLDLLRAIALGEKIGSPQLEWIPKFAVTTVVAAKNYPAKPELGSVIQLPKATGVIPFHCGTARRGGGGGGESDLVTSGGRVFAVTAVEDSLEMAAQRSREFAERIEFDGKQFRRDIGHLELERLAGAA
jgi:phosphoribosylamine--glycine ligase